MIALLDSFVNGKDWYSLNVKGEPALENVSTYVVTAGAPFSPPDFSFESSCYTENWGECQIWRMGPGFLHGTRL